ncbi:hypothetical protein HNR43_002713 [Anoxybacillus mongoliensis]|uniref:Uncharacterized protein n=1 Tax=Anoxybacillus mongoliensis TaxID=452565 RepID=A0A7W8N8V5_9BACL|nr:hypothetical protein [Anoxybacillus mongoliensis]
MSSRFFFGLLFIFVFGRMVEYYVETYILHPILQSAVLAIYIQFKILTSGSRSTPDAAQHLIRVL